MAHQRLCFDPLVVRLAWLELLRRVLGLVGGKCLFLFPVVEGPLGRLAADSGGDDGSSRRRIALLMQVLLGFNCANLEIVLAHFAVQLV